MSDAASPSPVARRGTKTDYVPSVFRLSKLAAPHTICAFCPAAIWFERETWHCFCNVMKFETWPGTGKPMTACDGRESAVAKYATDPLKAPPR